ncbi:uncharacterized protein LOC144704819 [Wolffia australiana]
MQLSQEAVVIKPPKKTSISLRMIILVLSMAFGIYICMICLRQSNLRSHENFVQVTVGRRCPSANLSHYPRPRTFDRRECACNPVKFFSIISMQRSGSGWFETFLNSHMNISSNGEIFSVKERRSNFTAIKATLDKVYNLDWMSSASKNECTSAVGFKWMVNQGLMEYHKEVSQYFNRRRVLLIFLFRRNLLRRMVSVIANSHDRFAKLLNGTHKSHVHSINEAAILASYKPVINTTLLLSDLRRSKELVDQAFDFFKTSRHIILYYEDLVSQRSQKLLEVQDFLGVPRRQLFSRQVKIHTRPLSQHIKNWDAVINAINGTEYEKFITSDYHM